MTSVHHHVAVLCKRIKLIYDSWWNWDENIWDSCLFKVSINLETFWNWSLLLFLLLLFSGMLSLMKTLRLSGELLKSRNQFLLLLPLWLNSSLFSGGGWRGFYKVPHRKCALPHAPLKEHILTIKWEPSHMTELVPTKEKCLDKLAYSLLSRPNG